MHYQVQKYHTAIYGMCVNHLRVVMIPYFDHPFRSACEKYCRTVRIPSNVVNWGVMSHVSLKKFRAVLRCTFIDYSFVRAHQEHDFIIGVEFCPLKIVYHNILIYLRQWKVCRIQPQ